MEEKKSNPENHSKKMIFGLIYPKRKHHIHMDQLTRAFLWNIEHNIGLLDVVSTWDTSLLSVHYRYSLFWNPECEGIAHVSKKGERWIVQVSLLSDEVQHDIVRYEFKRLPEPEDVLTANILNQIYNFYRFQRTMTSRITCVKCKTDFHWTEQPGTLQEKWNSLQDSSCGCE